MWSGADRRLGDTRPCERAGHKSKCFCASLKGYRWHGLGLCYRNGNYFIQSTTRVWNLKSSSRTDLVPGAFGGVAAGLRSFNRHLFTVPPPLYDFLVSW